METVTVRRSELLDALRTNREAHAGIVAEAIEGYQAECERLLLEHLAAVRSGRRKRIYVDLPEPVDQTRDYDRTIRMAEMSIDDAIELTLREFAQYVMDDWSWKQAFLASNSTYSATAGSLL